MRERKGERQRDRKREIKRERERERVWLVSGFVKVFGKTGVFLLLQCLTTSEHLLKQM